MTDIKLNAEDCAIVFRNAADGRDEVYVQRPAGSKDEDPLSPAAQRLMHTVAMHACAEGLLWCVQQIARHSPDPAARTLANAALAASAKLGLGDGPVKPDDGISDDREQVANIDRAARSKLN